MKKKYEKKCLWNEMYCTFYELTTFRILFRSSAMFLHYHDGKAARKGMLWRVSFVLRQHSVQSYIQASQLLERFRNSSDFWVFWNLSSQCRKWKFYAHVLPTCERAARLLGSGKNLWIIRLCFVRQLQLQVTKSENKTQWRRNGAVIIIRQPHYNLSKHFLQFKVHSL